jgi:glycosyltransferase involved in cell wall biosynthesis
MPPERTIATANPVNLEVIQRYSQAPPEHAWLQHKEQPVLMSVGRLAKQKNFAALIEAFALVNTQLDCRLIIFGEGPERENLTRQIQVLNLADRVSLPGFTSNPWCNMAQADLFVLPSEEEPFGLVLVEAMTCGLPIVATDAIGGGPRSVLESGRYGRLIPPQDVQYLAATLVELLSSPEQLQHFRQLGQERCHDYRPDRIAQQWIPFLEKMDSLPDDAVDVKKVAVR